MWPEYGKKVRECVEKKSIKKKKKIYLVKA